MRQIQIIYILLCRLLNGHSASGESDSSLHSHNAAVFLEVSGGSTIGIGAEGHSGSEDHLHLSDGSRMTRGSGFEAIAKHRKSVTKHDDSSQTEDGEFSPRGGGILNPDQTPRSENVQGVWSGSPRDRSTSIGDEVDSIVTARGCQGRREQRDGGLTHGAGAVWRVGPGTRGRSRECVEEYPHGVEDVGLLNQGHHASDPTASANPSRTDVRPKQLSAFTHVMDASAAGSKDATQVRKSVRNFIRS